MMKNDNIPENRHRGSSPPFQDPEQDFYKWLNGLKSVGQRDESASATRITGRSGNEDTRAVNPDDDRSNQGSGDESRWHDDGGRSGDAV